MKPTKCPAREKLMRQKKRKEGMGEREKYNAGQNQANQNIHVIRRKDVLIASGWMRPCVWPDEPMRVLWNASERIKTQ